MLQEVSFTEADGRASAIGVGLIGIVCVALTAAAIVALDVTNFVIRKGRRKARRLAGTYKTSTPPNSVVNVRQEELVEMK